MQEHTSQLSLFTSAANGHNLEISFGYCKCGCGQKTPISKYTCARDNLIKGLPANFLRGHNRRIPLEQRFWSKVTAGPSDQCWIWQGKTNSGGYGILKADGIGHNAHRIAWFLHFGAIPQDLHVCHKCDNRLCCNPNHLFLGTRIENMRDMVTKGRQATGDKVRHKRR